MNELQVTRENVLISRLFLFVFLSDETVNDLADSLSQPTTGPKMDDVIDVPTGGSQDTVSDWLLSMGLQQYLSVLVGNGFDDVDFLVSCTFNVSSFPPPAV